MKIACVSIYNLKRDKDFGSQRSTFQEHETRLNWRVATKTVKQLISELV